jgi:hypothetical protein
VTVLFGVVNPQIMAACGARCKTMWLPNVLESNPLGSVGGGGGGGGGYGCGGGAGVMGGLFVVPPPTQCSDVAYVLVSTVAILHAGWYATPLSVWLAEYCHISQPGILQHTSRQALAFSRPACPAGSSPFSTTTLFRGKGNVAVLHTSE